MNILNVPFSLSEEQEKTFKQKLFIENMHRSKLFAKIVIIFELGLLLLQLVAGILFNIYTLMYVLLILLAVGILALTKSYKSSSRTSEKRYKIYSNILIVLVTVFVIWGAVVTLLDQRIYGHVMAFAVNVMSVSILFHTSNKTILKIYSVPTAILAVGLPYFQPSHNVLIGHFINLAVFMFFCWLASRMLYTNYLQNFYNRLLLEEMNKNLTCKIAENEEINAELALANKQLKHLAVQDELSKIPNRRGFQEFIHQVFQGEKRRHQLSIIMLDIDAFKLYNDYYGHPQGDKVIQTVAHAIKSNVASQDIIAARYGGEEFIIASFNFSLNDMVALAECIRSEVENLKMPHEVSPISNYVTLSLGVAFDYVQSEEELEHLIEKADQALYVAKQHGRNRLEVFENVAEPI